MAVACIVEGHGEVEAVPALIRRIAVELSLHVRIADSIRSTKSLLIRPNSLEKRIELAVSKAGAGCGVFVLIDSDDDRPDELLQDLSKRVKEFPHIRCAVAVAVPEFESWLIAGVEGLRRHRGFSSEAAPPEFPESVRDAKKWLSRWMPAPYAPTEHQAAFTWSFDMAAARLRSPSFARCYREIGRLLREIAP